VQRYGIEEPMHEFSRGFRGRFYLIVIRIVEKFTAGAAETIIVPSEYLRRVVSNWGVPKEKIVIIRNSFEREGALPTHAEARERLKATGKIIISAGRLVPWKGFGTLIEIVYELMDEIPGILLWIAGEGPERYRLEGLIEKYTLHGRVMLLGNLQKKELFEHVAAADVFVLNTFYEGFSHQILEAMAIGTPVVTTTSGGNPELLAHEREGLLVSYNDREGLKGGIKKMLSDDHFARSCAERAKEKADSFSTERMMEGIIKVLR
jgi:glycosyltransferase involved in cell wall biosynthesis